jgi:CRP/FNR family transcriptional regulator, cyclic AMP receptor protein
MARARSPAAMGQFGSGWAWLVLDGKDHDINPVAVDALEVITAPISKIRQWIETQPLFNRSFLPYLGENIRRLENISADLALDETITRLAKLILRQAKPDASITGEEYTGTLLINTLSDEAMARMIGSVRVVVNRHIQEFIQRGIISTSRGQLVVRDLDKLKALCERLLPR